MIVSEKLLFQNPAANTLESGFSLAEVLVAIGILSVVFAGLIYGYVQANRIAEWTSMSLAAQSYASQGTEQARAAHWSYSDSAIDELPPTNYSFVGIMDIPIKGNPTNTGFAFWVTNYVTVTNYSANPPLRLIRTDCRWIFSLTGQPQTNTVILIRAPDQ
jgi:prepilin-type N-terminal cleavage/methylation domain-containing protein